MLLSPSVIGQPESGWPMTEEKFTLFKKGHKNYVTFLKLCDPAQSLSLCNYAPLNSDLKHLLLKITALDGFFLVKRGLIPI